MRIIVPAIAFLLAFSSAPLAHEVPTDVTVHTFIKPEGQQLRFLVRVPLEAMADVEFPKRGPGYLDLARADASLRDAATMWIVESIQLFEERTQLTNPRLVAARASLPSDQSFRSYDGALAHVMGAPLPPETDLYWNQAMLDVLYEYPIRSDRSRFAILPDFDRLGLRVTTIVRFLSTGGAERGFEMHGDPGMVMLDPRWHQAAMRFVGSGFFHILDGIDHLLFLLCLVIPFRRIRPLVSVVTAFTVAHSITLVASAYDFAPSALWFPPLIETLIAVSIVYMALENIVGARLNRRWIFAFGFGLVHGFGFSFALRETLQFAGAHLLTSLLSFNLGVELGQLLVLMLFIPALDLMFRFAVAESVGRIILSALVVHTGWHWMTERAERLSQFPWPVLDAALLASAIRWAMMLLVTGGILWWLSGILRRRAKESVDAPRALEANDEPG